MANPLTGAPVPSPPLVPTPVNIVRSSRRPRDDGDVRWQSGITYRPALNYEAYGYSQCGTASSMPTGTHRPDGRVSWFPIVQVQDMVCSSFGWETTDWRGDLRKLLDDSLPKFLETELWTGAIAQIEGLDNLWLASTHSVDITGGTAVSVKRGYELLEAGLGDVRTGAQGMIHARRSEIPNFTGIRREGNLLLTPLDTIVVPGVGYKGTDRSGAAASAGTSWMYATGITDVRIDDNITWIPGYDGDAPFEVDRTNNTVTLRAEREVMVSWDGIVHLAVHVSADT